MWLDLCPSAQQPLPLAYRDCTKAGRATSREACLFILLPVSPHPPTPLERDDGGAELRKPLTRAPWRLMTSCLRLSSSSPVTSSSHPPAYRLVVPMPSSFPCPSVPVMGIHAENRDRCPAAYTQVFTSPLASRRRRAPTRFVRLCLSFPFLLCETELPNPNYSSDSAQTELESAQYRCRRGSI
jgi:hypothetical protein